MKSSKKWIYLPVEIKSRDLIPKLFFANLATRSGFGVFIGRNGMNISRDRFPRGIYFDKCLSPHKIDFHKYQVSSLGNTLISLDEESLIVDDSHAEERFSQSAIDLSSIIFVWGQREASMIGAIYDLGKKVRSVGSPRVDCWRPQFGYFFESEIKNIKDRFGEFILVPSNFGEASLPEDRFDETAKQYLKFTSCIREEFLGLINRIAKEFPSRNIVVRPHPSDNQGAWMSLRTELPTNVHVILEGSVSPWIKAASFLIHHCCTTAIEAWFSRVPLISYEPLLSAYPGYSPFHELPTKLSQRCVTQQEVVDYIKSGVEVSASRYIKDLAALRKYLDFEDHELSSKKILAEINKLSIETVSYQIPSFTLWKKIRAFLGRIKYRFSDLWNANPIHFNNNRQKNPGMQLHEIVDLMDRIQIEGDQHQIPNKIYQVDVDTFCIFRD
ncbi:hypothetical protein OAT46_01550 [Gammaproteobacteria bacterium]|nr:hypothetical protein [Gammaproteobacteria bacterium]